MTALDELKHSIKTYVLLAGGTTAELATYLIKVVDFLEDKDPERRQTEMFGLAFVLIEATALSLQRTIDIRLKKDPNFPAQIATKSDGLLVIVGKSRSLSDKLTAKNAVLTEIAETLRALSTYTKVKYPDLTTASGSLL